MNKKLVSPQTDFLMDAILSLKTREECYDFFEDLCTVFEITEFGRRLDVAKMLASGQSYNEIVEKSGFSTATISRVNACLKYGSGGYSQILQRLEKPEKK